ncbi:MAG: DNA-formamidopyrimidine glycosylase [Candidatus Saelkia tenebricola]|nr:DNA-formamidopyrimidine glycosylase [Candidatus Saelkia tenebricola]
MPELPEVETIRRELRSLILNKKIKDFQVKDSIFLKKPKSKAVWRKNITSKVKDVTRQGKFLIIQLSNGLKVVIHLRMTGQIIYGGDDGAKIKIVFSDSSTLSYYDKRRFGEWYLVKNEKEIPLLCLLGADPTEESFTIDVLSNLLQKRNTKAYDFLLDQRSISGIGNIYVNEILYNAKLSPFRKTREIKADEIEQLYYSIREILNKALKARGSSVDTYLDIWGNPGKYAYQHVVYGKEGEFCAYCPNKIMRGKLSSRSIYFCPGCQQ